MRYVITVFSILLTVIINQGFSQIEIKYHKEHISLDTSLTFEKTVCIDYHIATFYFNYNDFKNYCCKYRDRQIDSLFIILEKSILNDTIILNSFTPCLFGLTEGYIVNAIDLKQIVVLNNKSKIKEQELIKYKFKKQARYPCGGRKYFIKGNKKVLIETIDWIT